MVSVHVAAISLFLSLFCVTPARGQDTAPLDEIVVTGSHIHGAEAAGSKLIVIDREQIDASGYGRIEDVLAMLTQNFNRANGAVPSGAEVDNLNRGAEVQLRGLGIGTTLTLVNGQRQGASGFQGSFVDVSTIPASAVARIEILPEGASALYGSDAIGGVVNIILRKDLEGFEARARASTADGDANERTLAGLWGHAGSNGHVLLGFDYDDSRALECSARARCAANGDFRSYGGTDLRMIGGSPGTLLDPFVGAIPHGQDGTHLTASQLNPGAVNYANSVAGTDILPQQIMRSAFLSAAYSLSSHWELSLDGRYSSRAFESTYPQFVGDYSVPATNAFNHFGVPVTVAYDLTADVGPIVDSGPTDTSSISAALRGALPGGWQLHLASAYSRSSTEFNETNLLNADAVNAALSSTDPAAALNIFGDGSHSNPAVIAALRAQSGSYRALNVFSTLMGSVISDGPLFTGPAGPIRVAIGSDFRREHSEGLNIADGPEDRGRNAAAGFFEFAVPLLDAPAGSIADRLGLSIAGRYDRYSDVGGRFDPKVGLSWRPARALQLRGNWGTSFRPPPFFWSDPDQTGDGRIEYVPDPRSPSQRTLALELIGPHQDLRPETSTAWSIGADLAPQIAPNLSLSMTYFDIDYQGKIRPPGSYARLFLTQEAQFASLIVRNPTPAQLDAACSGVKRLFSDVGNCDQRIGAILDNRFRNLDSLETRGADFSLDYAFDSTRGRWTVGMNGTYTLAEEQRITPNAPVFDFINTVGNPLKLRWAAHLSWMFKEWTALTTLNYTGSYGDPGSLPARSVGSWTTVDLNIGYRVRGGNGWLADTQGNLGVTNLLDRSPPFVNQFDINSGDLGYDAANASLLGRQISVQIIKHWGR